MQDFKCWDYSVLVSAKNKVGVFSPSKALIIEIQNQKVLIKITCKLTHLIMQIIIKADQVLAEKLVTIITI